MATTLFCDPQPNGITSEAASGVCLTGVQAGFPHASRIENGRISIRREREASAYFVLLLSGISFPLTGSPENKSCVPLRMCYYLSHATDTIT